MADRREGLTLVAIAAFWLVAARALPELLWRVLPKAFFDSLSLPAYSTLCQLVTTLMGLGAARVAFAHPAATLGVRKPSATALFVAVLLTPLLFVAASVLAIKIAQPFLLEELAREGAGATRRNAGAFGRAITEAPLLITLVWGAVLAAVAEELAFRGALFAAVEKSAFALLARAAPSETPIERSGFDWRSGAVAVVLSAATFGAMHADMKGSVGIVRVASATFLGLACGSLRLLTGTVVVPMFVHFVYNSVSVGLGRGVFRGDDDPLISVIPNRLLALAALAASVAAGILAARRVFRDPSAPAL